MSGPAPSPRAFESVRIPAREGKPRSRGLTYAREPGVTCEVLDQHLSVCADYVDIVKFRGFVPRLQPRHQVAARVDAAHRHGTEVALGGALLEAGLVQGREVVERVLDEAGSLGFDLVEVGRQLVRIPSRHICAVVHAARDRGLRVIAEAGLAYGIRPGERPARRDVAGLVGELTEYLAAGAWRVVLESEGITENVTPEDFRWDVLDAVVAAVGRDALILEADDPLVWTRLLDVYGFELNLFVDMSRVTRLEAARRGLWSQPHGVTWRVGSFDGGERPGPDSEGASP